MTDEAIALDGFLDDAPVPGDPDSTTARFRLTVSPTDERIDEMTLPCSVADPQLAHTTLHELIPGDKLRATGYLRAPRTPDEPLLLIVETLEILQPAPQLTATAALFASVIERCGPYLHYIDGDSGGLEVWNEAGAWVGWADTPGELTAILDAFERGQAPGRE
ncbi:hypothetical protein [Streptomyces sp. NBC_01264]|uniref:hypothetical protein n=1 Tax=Streptomyces sp. NBC_01264 TaxID=2903804 RepID=UPI0022539E78|nr:hypothetical protein [Streptomyces sp. NBC_01264]MCX4784485.1 hypothetical protein [Streptomyces sp. NBC_01264]